MDYKINYIIASYPGITNSRRFNYSEKCLSLQLEKLRDIIIKKKTLGIPCIIKRVTIIVNTVYNPNINFFKNYYQFDTWKQMFDEIEIDIVFQDYKGLNLHHSYDQWIQGMISSLNEFTHHIIIEDDYCIDENCVDFDIKLVEIYLEKFKDNIGYLSEKCGDNTHPPHQYHSWISNGLISSDTMKKLQDPLNLFYRYREYPQIDFSYLFTDNGIPLADYSDYFRVPFWNQLTSKIDDFSSNKDIKQACIIPVEELLFKH